MIYTIHALNAKLIATRFERMGYAAVSAKPAMETVAEMMMRIFGAIFESQGRRGGGSWKRDTTEWLTRKQRLGLDPRINQATGALRRAMSEPGDEHQILAITDTSIHLGTNLDYAQAVNRVRPFVKFRKQDREAMRRVIRDYLVAAWKETPA